MALEQLTSPCLSFQGEIHRVKTDGTNRTVLASLTSSGSSMSLALDWISKNLYYTDPETPSIEVMIP